MKRFFIQFFAVATVFVFLAPFVIADDYQSNCYDEDEVLEYNNTFFCRETSTIIANFKAGDLPFPDYTIITDQFKKYGLIFSSDDSDLPGGITSLGLQENNIISGSFFNLFKLNFINRRKVIRVSVTLRDHNFNSQSHILYAFDKDANIVDMDRFIEGETDGDSLPNRFTLTVSSCSGIAFIVALEQPFGAEKLERITYTTGKIIK